MKKHFKLYKSGKLWVTAAVAVLSFAVSANLNQASASDNTDVTSTQNEYFLGNNDKSNDSNITTNINGYTNQNSTWKNTSGQSANGWQTSGNDWYHFNNGNQNKDWQNIDNNWYYMNPDNAKMETGIQKINNKTYYLNEQHDGTYGAMKTGWQYVDGNWYGFKGDGSAYTGWNYLHGNWYYMNPETAVLESGIQKINNNFYYLNDKADGTFGAMKTGWQYVDGHWYGFKGDGSAYLGWQNLGGNTYYFKPENAQMATGDTLISGNYYYFDPASGHQLKGMLVDANTKLLKYYDPSTGIRQTELTVNGHTYKFNQLTGVIDTTTLNDGLNQIAGHVYYYNRSASSFAFNSWQKLNDAWYHFNNDGTASIGWFKSPAGFWYYFNNDGAILLGWQKLNNKWYHFNNTNASADTGWFKTPAGFWYYLDPTNAWAHTGWYKSAAGFWYYFDNNNANALTSWQKINNAWYYFDNVNAFAWTNWHLINGSWYFFDLANAWADTGYHIINGIEYYFDPVNANLYQNRWVNVNGWTYHADNSGRLWFPQWYSQFPYGEGCSVFSLAMMLSPKEYINTGYAINLLQYRQAGNVYNGAGFYLIIQPNSLVELAHHFDSSVRNISGSSVQGIIDTINSGRPVLYYGYSRYERSYAHHNHAKVIVGYQNGWFRVFDPCYNYASQGSFGWNAYDYGAKGWITTAQFAREYAGQAITVD
ncbi:C39 family peptidase [Limosilactobacillus vaginalis]|uniref:C39 family peptidase n=1 Tax=Limosilactobacillus vaginalis TaxID=1633 RepID=UPI00242EF8C2|nr:C39 family peptidase [Limosilactobacillus vaginalis]MCI6853255.1 C39 family peptidase [Limosilactobacillus vaginalis]